MRGNIPVIVIEEETIPKAYEKALIKLYENGIEIKTQYDGENPPSLDTTANITVLDPLQQPMVHKAFLGGIEALREYCMEMEGCKDHWVKNMNDPDDTRWEYTYHQRFSDWGTHYEKRKYPNKDTHRLKINYQGDPTKGGINQIDIVIDKLVKQYDTRQAQMITWMPYMDVDIYDPPCLQSIWYRLIEYKGILYLNCDVRIRSNDAWGAFFMNIFAIVMFNQNVIIKQLKERMTKPIIMGRINWQADSYHIYGKDIKDFENRFYYRSLITSIKDRTYSLDDPEIKLIWDESEQKVIDKIKKYDEEHTNGETQ